MNRPGCPVYFCPIYNTSPTFNCVFLQSQVISSYHPGNQLFSQISDMAPLGISAFGSNSSAPIKQPGFQLNEAPPPSFPSGLRFEDKQSANKGDQGCRNRVDETKQIKLQGKNKKRYVQNPRRNVITNLGAQLLSFLGNRTKQLSIFENLRLTVSQEDLSLLLLYVQMLKEALGSYINTQKMRQLWYPRIRPEGREHIICLFRKVSYYFLSNLARLLVLRSNKINNETRGFHLQGIREFIKILKNPPRYYLDQ